MGIKGVFVANILARLLAIVVVELRLQTLRHYFSIKISGKRGSVYLIMSRAMPLPLILMLQ